MNTAGCASDNPFERLRLRGLLGWLLVFGFPLLLAFRFLRFLLPWYLPQPDVVLLWTDSLYLVVFAWILTVRRRVNLRLHRLVGPPRLSWLPKGLLCLLSLVSYLLCVEILRVDFVCRILPSDCQAMQATPVSTNPVLEAFSAVIAGPIVEELLFRGILLHGIVARRGLTRGILVSCILFAASHGPQAPGVFLLGLLLTLIYIRTASLWISVSCHALYNTVVTVHELVVQLGGLSVPLGIYHWRLVAVAMIDTLFVLIVVFWILWPRSGESLPYQRNATEPDQ